jgi:hypothetical protein
MTQPQTFNMPLEEAMRTQRAIRRLRPDRWTTDLSFI